MLGELWHRMNNLLVRFTLDGSDDTKGIQYVKGRGRMNEGHGSDQAMIPRLQQAGLSSRPSAGAGTTGITVMLDGNNDKAIVIVLENRDKRPTNLEDGETVVYDEFGDSLKLDKNQRATLTAKTIVLVATEKIILQAPEVHLGADGGAAVAVLGSTTSDGAHVSGACATKVFAV